MTFGFSGQKRYLSWLSLVLILVVLLSGCEKPQKEISPNTILYKTRFITTGMYRQEMLLLFGEPESASDYYEGYGEFWDYDFASFTIFNGRVLSITVSDPHIKTYGGLSLGDSRAALQDVFPDLENYASTETDEYYGGYMIFFDDDLVLVEDNFIMRNLRYAVSYAVEENIITYISITDFDLYLT